MAQWTTTYAGLVSAIGDFCEDSSSEFTSALPGIVNRAEERVLRDLDITYFDDRRSVSTANGVASVAKTSDMIAVQSVRFTAANEFALRRSYEFLKLYGGTGRPLYYYDDDTDIIFAPVPDATYACEVKFLSRPSPLTSSNQTNWLALNAADMLLYAALKEAEHFLVAPERLAEFEAAYAQRVGPVRAVYKADAGPGYDPVGPASKPERTR